MNVALPRRYHVIALIAIALFLGYLFYNNPNVSFRSSDGKWADAEYVGKGRTFEVVIVPEFELYKLECGKPSVALLRTTTMDWYNVFGWPSYLTNPKWRVPYTGSIPGQDRYHISDRDTAREINDSKKADANARAYIKSLR